MWVQYRLSSGKKKKFRLSSSEPIPRLKEDTPGKGDFCWQVDDPKYIAQEELKNKAVRDQETQLVGFAILVKDRITGFKQWATYAHDGTKHTNLSPQQPLVIPVESKLQLGTRIEIRTPV